MDDFERLAIILPWWAEIVTEHGLILLEVHCQDPVVVRAHIDQSESLYFGCGILV